MRQADDLEIEEIVARVQSCMLFEEEELMQDEPATQLEQLKSEVQKAKEEAEGDRRKMAELQESLELQICENEKLRRQIEMITQLRSTNKLRDCESIAELQPDSQVDCEWSNRQLYASDVSARERILHEVSDFSA